MATIPLTGDALASFNALQSQVHAVVAGFTDKTYEYASVAVDPLPPNDVALQTPFDQALIYMAQSGILDGYVVNDGTLVVFEPHTYAIPQLFFQQGLWRGPAVPWVPPAPPHSSLTTAGPSAPGRLTINASLQSEPQPQPQPGPTSGGGGLVLLGAAVLVGGALWLRSQQ